MVYPTSAAVGPPPADGMPEPARSAYNEARRVAAGSQRAARALLRLAVELIVRDLAKEEGNLNELIGVLVRDGSVRMPTQRAMDIVRVHGNNAVHPGKINDDDQVSVESLFMLANMIVEDTYQHEAALEEFYKTLPQGSRDAIERRDGQPKQRVDSADATLPLPPDL